ncbi:MAG: DegV family protein [Oscillospiraceae bacterium]|nr:DegV family protein [Oscillospiraceae bacterium]
MEKILFVIDSPGDLTKEEIAGKPIWVIPVMVSYNGMDVWENEIEPRQFWKDLVRMEEIPRTTMIVPDDWLQIYRKAKAEGYTNILVHTLSSTASGICNSAFLARKLLSDEERLPIEIVDSRSYAFIYGRNILKCAEMAEQGVPFAQIVKTLRDLTARNRGILWVYTLKHLKKSGRISGMKAFVGEALGLRPLLLIKDGVIAPIDKVRGDGNVIPRAAQLVMEHAVAPETQRIEILYADVPPSEIERAQNIIGEMVRPKEMVLHHIGGVIAINCGPIAMAACFYGEPFELEAYE